MSAVERAAEVLEAAHIDDDRELFRYSGGWLRASEALADAGLLVTDEMQVVLDAAVEWVRADMNDSSYLERCSAHFKLRQAVRGFKPEVIPPAGQP